MSNPTTKFKKYVSDFTFRLGPIATTGALYPIRKPKSETETSFKRVTPEGKAVKQFYRDEEGNEFTQGQLESATEVGGQLVLVGKDNVAAKRASLLPANVMNITVHNKAEIDYELYNSDNQAYVFEPNSKDPANVQWHQILVGLASRENKAFIGLCNLRSYEGLFRVSVWRGRLIVQKQLYSDQINDHAQYNTAIQVDEGSLNKASALLDKLEKPFDPANYENAIHSRLEAMNEAIANGDLVPTISEDESVPTGTIDINSLLDDFEV